MPADVPWKLNTYGEQESPTKSLISYIVVAEFDIDTGSTVRHQYPSKIPNCKEDWLAEHMLPEGVHNRDVDYTFIFLNRNSQILSDTDNTLRHPHHQHQQPSSDDSELFLYGLNLCRTKYDSTVRRGAIVKSMTLFSPYHFIEILKKPLDKALAIYFDNPCIDILKVRQMKLLL